MKMKKKKNIILNEYRHEVRRFEKQLLKKAIRRVFAELIMLERHRNLLNDQLKAELKNFELKVKYHGEIET